MKFSFLRVIHHLQTKFKQHSKHYIKLIIHKIRNLSLSLRSRSTNLFILYIYNYIIYNLASSPRSTPPPLTNHPHPAASLADHQFWLESFSLETNVTNIFKWFSMCRYAVLKPKLSSSSASSSVDVTRDESSLNFILSSASVALHNTGSLVLRGVGGVT